MGSASTKSKETLEGLPFGAWSDPARTTVP